MERRQRQTSIEVYHQISENGLLSKKRFEVYDILFHHGAMTGAEVSQKHKELYPTTKATVSETVRNRITELRDMGVVQELGDTECPITGKKVILWDVTANLPKDLPKKLSKKQRIDRAVKAVVDLGQQENLAEEHKEELRKIYHLVKNI